MNPRRILSSVHDLRVPARGSVTNDLLCYSRFWFAKVAELADAPDLGSGTERCGGSSPPFRTIAVSSEQ